MDNDRYEDLVAAVYKHEMYGRVTDVKLRYAQYRTNGTLALRLDCQPGPGDIVQADGENPFCEAYATVTVNLPDSDTLAVNEQYVDTNNLPGIDSWLVNSGLATPTGHITRSGYCLYESFLFNVPDRIIRQTIESREDGIAADIIRTIESSSLTPLSREAIGETYSLGNSQNYPYATILLYNGKGPEHMGSKRDVFLLMKGSYDQTVMNRFRSLPPSIRAGMDEAIRSAVSRSSSLKR